MFVSAAAMSESTTRSIKRTGMSGIPGGFGILLRLSSVIYLVASLTVPMETATAVGKG